MSSKAPKLQFHILTLFPEVFPPFLDSSLIGKAVKKGLVGFSLHQIRDHATDKHRTVDDTPYGGGEGMVLRADVLHACWKAALPRKSKSARTILLSPQGRPLTQEKAKELSQFKTLVLVCGHYEGVDERFIDECVDEELSIGDYVLTGGEIAAAVVCDTVTRLIPGVVKNPRSLTEDTFEGGLLKYPQFTRPADFRGRKVPEILLSGDHGKIKAWRDEERRKRTRAKRPDLIKQ